MGVRFRPSDRKECEDRIETMCEFVAEEFEDEVKELINEYDYSSKESVESLKSEIDSSVRLLAEDSDLTEYGNLETRYMIIDYFGDDDLQFQRMEVENMRDLNELFNLVSTKVLEEELLKRVGGENILNYMEL